MAPTFYVKKLLHPEKLLNQNCTQWSRQEYFHENMNTIISPPFLLMGESWAVFQLWIGKEQIMANVLLIIKTTLVIWTSLASWTDSYPIFFKSEIRGSLLMLYFEVSFLGVWNEYLLQFIFLFTLQNHLIWLQENKMKRCHRTLTLT